MRWSLNRRNFFTRCITIRLGEQGKVGSGSEHEKDEGFSLLFIYQRCFFSYLSLQKRDGAGVALRKRDQR